MYIKNCREVLYTNIEEKKKTYSGEFRLRPNVVKSLQSCPTLYNPINGSPPGSPIPGILQARILE